VSFQNFQKYIYKYIKLAETFGKVSFGTRQFGRFPKNTFAKAKNNNWRCAQIIFPPRTLVPNKDPLVWPDGARSPPKVFVKNFN
jgi:hypothetical protein